VIGIAVEFMGVPWFLALELPPPETMGQAIFRLKALSFAEGWITRGIRLRWS
jgi:hypothetical protein